MTVWLLRLSWEFELKLSPLGPSLNTYKSFPSSWGCKTSLIDKQGNTCHILPSVKRLTREQHAHTPSGRSEWQHPVPLWLSTGLKQQQYKHVCSLESYLSGAPLATWRFKRKQLTLLIFLSICHRQTRPKDASETTKPNITAFPNVTLLCAVRGQKLTRRGDGNVILLGERQFFVVASESKNNKEQRRINEWVFEHRLVGFGITGQAGGERETGRAS